MQFVALAGIDTEAVAEVSSKLSGTRADRTDPLGLEIAQGRIGDVSFTLATLPPDQVAHSQSLAGALLADAAVLVVSAKAGWGPFEASVADELRSVGVSTVVVAIDDPANCSASLPHAIRQQLGIFEFSQTAVVMIDSQNGQIEELITGLDSVLSGIPVNGYKGPTRLWVQRSYHKDGVGTVAVGFVTGKALNVDGTLNTVDGKELTVRAIQQLEARADASPAGSYVAVNFGEIDPKVVSNANVLVTVADKDRINQVESVLTVRRGTKSSVHATQTYAARIGTISCYAALNTLEGSSLAPGHRGAARIRLSQALPLFVGDRILLCDINSGEVVAGGTISETALSLDTAERNDISALLKNRGWIDVDEFEQLTGSHRPATLGHWVVDLGALEEASNRVRSLVSQAGAGGIDITSLNDKELAVLRTLSGIEVVNGRAFMAGIEPDFALKAVRTTSIGI